MAQKNPSFTVAPGFTVDPEHDWHSAEYVDKWITRDLTRPERVGYMEQMMATAKFSRDAEIKVLDVGGGNGLVTEFVLKFFPKSRVTVQDYSQPMLDKARERFAMFGDQVSYSRSDLLIPGWEKTAGGPFDLVVSSIAIHNLGNMDAIGATYKAIYSVLKSGGQFLDNDHLANVGGVQLHLDALKAAGFSKAECIREGKPAIITGLK
ncbi:MAG TPA: methyltransferase domain-containing protein [Candidatus Binatia bacterium]|nr:methyltransferase domain-containing protein [Candidatus Binatia bacterium]